MQSYLHISEANESFTFSYYIYVPISVSVKPLLLVPSGEVSILLQEINDKLGLHLDFPARSEERAFRIDFSDDGTPRPRFLGICTSRTSFDIMEKKIPPEDFTVKGEETKVDITDDRSYPAFKAKMELAVQATKNKSKASKEKKKITRVHQKHSMYPSTSPCSLPMPQHSTLTWN